jgi:hypothetical protein
MACVEGDVRRFSEAGRGSGTRLDDEGGQQLAGLGGYVPGPFG